MRHLAVAEVDLGIQPHLRCVRRQHKPAFMRLDHGHVLTDVARSHADAGWRAESCRLTLVWRETPTEELP